MDKAFFVQEVEACSGMLFRVAYTLLHEEEACKDALQEAVLRAWEKRTTLRNEAFFRTWLTRILIRVCQDMHRRRRPTVPLEGLPALGVPPPDPTLALALQALPEKLRLPLMLHYCDRMTYAQVAQALALPAATVRGRVHRAKALLRKELSEP